MELYVFLSLPLDERGSKGYLDGDVESFPRSVLIPVSVHVSRIRAAVHINPLASFVGPRIRPLQPWFAPVYHSVGWHLGRFHLTRSSTGPGSVSSKKLILGPLKFDSK